MRSNHDPVSAVAEKIRTAPYERPPVHFTKRGVAYVKPAELVQSAAFWRAVVATHAMRGLPV